jgi:hypothetical protein
MSDGFTVHIEFDPAKLMARIEAESKKGIAIVANEALKDANYYAREDTGMMIHSSITASRPEEGGLVWDTPYAKKMYYTGVPSTDTNPNASLMWAHRGYAENHEKYDRIMAHAHHMGAM